MPVLGTIIFLLHRLPDDNEDNAPFQIDPLGVQGKQLHRVPVPPVDKNLFSGTNSETPQAPPRTYLRLHWLDSGFDFTDVPLALEESAF